MKLEFGVKEIDDHTWCIKERDYRIYVYFYLIEGEERAALVDTGFGHLPLKAMVETLTDKPVVIINTHFHADHVGGNGDYDTIYLHPKDRAGYLEAAKGNSPYPCPRPINTETIDVVEGDEIDLGNRVLRIVECPGHSDGHIAVLDVSGRRIFTGDLCFRGETLAFDQNTGLVGYREQLQKVYDMGDQYDLIWPAHIETPMEKETLKRLIDFAQDIIDGKVEEQEFVDAKFSGYKFATRDELSFAYAPINR